MFYKSSILAAILALLSMGNAIAAGASEAIAAELSQIESFTAKQQSEPDPNLQPATAQNSASIAKAQLLKIPTPSYKNSASIAKARLQNLSSKETLAADSLAKHHRRKPSLCQQHSSHQYSRPNCLNSSTSKR